MESQDSEQEDLCLRDLVWPLILGVGKWEAQVGRREQLGEPWSALGPLTSAVQNLLQMKNVDLTLLANTLLCSVTPPVQRETW